jgi:hypothetical protein
MTSSAVLAPPTPELTRTPPVLRGPAQWLRGGVVLGANTLGVLAILSLLLPEWPAAGLCFALALATTALAYRWGLTRDPTFLAVWVSVSVGVALVSFFTGWHNGLTDEPYATPAFAQLWPNLYGQSINLAYTQYGTPHSIVGLYNVYLPGLAFAVIPGISYAWTAMAAWLGTVYLLRKHGAAGLLWGGAWVGVMAANGFNDFVPLFALTLTFVTLTGRASKVAEVASLVLKQFANVVVIAVHLYHRQWRAALFAAAVTAAILAPFAVLSPGGVACHALLIQPFSCSAGPGPMLGPGILRHFNYLLWPLWAIAVFAPNYLRAMRNPAAAGWRGRLVRRFPQIRNALG